jgi:YbbR domain-containing protein
MPIVPITRTKKLKSRLLTNVRYKVLALLISCGIWYVVQSEETVEVTKRLDVTFDVPSGLAVREGKSVTRDVTVRGPRLSIGDSSNKSLHAVLRLPSGKRGTQRYRLDRDLIENLDPRVKLTVHDPYITIFVDERASRSVPIKVAISGNPKRGVIIRDVVTEPSELTVTGLKADVQKLQEISTEIVDLGGISESKSFPVPISLVGLPDFDLSAQQVVVKVSVSEGTATKAIDGLHVEVSGSDYFTQTNPRQVSIVLQGTAEALAKLSTRDIAALIDAKDLAPGRYERDIFVRTPPDIYVSSIVPKRVTVLVENVRRMRMAP